MTLEHSSDEEDFRKNPREEHMEEGEVFVGNAVDFTKLPTIRNSAQQIQRELLRSDKYSSVRIVPNAAYDSSGQKLPNYAAIFVKPKSSS